MPSSHTLACYYFPNYHLDPRNEAQHGPGWTEWELVRRAEPRFPGHRQPRLPLWGEEDEADPAVMARKIAAAADHGLDAFIFDWYWYNDGPYLERGLERGFLGAANNDRLKFALMWANHDWVDIHPAKLHARPGLLYPGAITPATWETMTDYVIERYFRHPSYWRIAERPYFSVYELYRLVQSFGSLAATREALQRFRAKARAAGLPGLHLNAVVWGVKILPGEQAIASPAELVDYLGFDSVTSYVWIHHIPLREFPVTDYAGVARQAARQWGELAGQFPIPYYPNVTIGWDSSPRTVQSDRFVNAGYPFMPALGGNTPAAFREALLGAKLYLDEQPAERRILTINAWNEWTEGSYLEPDSVYGLGYLQAIKDTFPKA